MATLGDLFRYLTRSLGVRIQPYPPNYEGLLLKKRYQPLEVQLAGKPFRIADAFSFYYSYRELFVDRIYSFPSARPNPFILDCGANYGASIAFFKQEYPKAKILGFEPDPDLFSILSKNAECQGWSDVELRQQAIWDKNTSLTFNATGADTGRIGGAGFGKAIQVEAIRLQELLQQYEVVDFLKLDIEGAETTVLQDCRDLTNVQHLFVEYHAFPGQAQLLEQVLSRFVENGFRYYVQTAFSPARPFQQQESQYGMDLQLNIFGVRS